MIDAEEAETLAGAAAEKEEAHAREQGLAAAAARERERREAAKRMRVRAEMERRRAERLVDAAATKRGAAPSAADETLEPTVAKMTNVAALAVVEEPGGSGQPDAGREARAHKALLKADKRAAKQAAKQIAALEKKEARERKALAKAAARRRTR